MKNLIAVPVAVSERKELFAVDAYLWAKLCQWLPRQPRRLRRVVSYALMVGLLCQMALPITAVAANEREGKRAREEAINKRREARSEKPAPSPSPLAAAGASLMQGGVGLLLSEVATPFNGLTGLAYHEAQHKLLAAVNAPNGQPRNLELIAASGAHTAYANVSNQGGELRLATARDDGNGKSLANFNRGELFFTTSANGVIARLSANGATLQNPWVTLGTAGAGEGGRVTGLTLDRTGGFSGHVIAVTATGRIYRVTASGQGSLVTNLNTPLSGVTVLPNDVAKYGPWAGRILAGAPTQGLIYAVNAVGQSVSQSFGVNPSELLVVPAQENFYGVDSLSQKVWGAPDEAFGTMTGDILIAQSQPGTLAKLHWNGTSFVYTQLVQTASWQQLTFSPVGIAPLAEVPRFYDKIALVRHGLTMNGGDIEGAIWQLNPEEVQLNGNATITSDLLVPGTPTVTLSGTPSLVGTLDGTGNPQPTNYQVKLSGNASLRYVVRRVDPIAMPTITSPSSPTGTRDLQLNNNNTNPGDWTTVRHVDINGSIAAVTMPPGAFGNVSVNGNNILQLGVAGTTTPLVYHMQELQVNGNSEIRVLSPIILRVKNRVTINGGSTGSAATPSWLRLEIDNGNVSNALTINGNSTVYAIVRTPLGRVTLNGNSRLCGTVSCDELQINGNNSVLQVCESDTPPPPVNRPPTVTAGADQTINLPATASLAGTVTDDGLPTGATLTYSWSKTSGPGNVTFSAASALTTTASFETAGTYTLKLTANDSQLTASDEIIVTVNGGNTAPTANAGADQTISLPTSSVNVSGTGSDDGLPTGSTLTYVWSKVSGPGTTTFGNANTAATSATFSTNGTYALRLTVSDGSLTGTDDVTIFVNRAPVVSAGANQSIELSANSVTGSVTLAGTVTDDGLPAGAAVTSTWSKLTGPGTVTFANAANPATTATFSTPGVYVLQLAANDTLATGTATVTITVNAANQAPSVNAGLDQTISLPTNQVALNGSATDDGKPTGAALSYVWTKVSGPGTVTFTNANTAATNATFSASGVYTLRLTASDTLLSGADDVIITVNSAPVVNAGADQLITLPTASANLLATFTDDNLPAPVAYSHQWTKVSGVGSVTFSAPTSLTTDATFGQGGVYVLRLTTSDSLVSGSDDITVIVNTAPSANAGADQLISLPNNTAALAGTGSDPDNLPTNGPLTYSWSKVSGPGNVTFSAGNSANTNSTFSAAGAYVLRLTVSDSAATGTDDVIVIVNAAPIVNAGADQSVNFNQTATMNGSATDDGFPTGATLSYAWSKFNGPGNVTFGTANASSTSATFSASGVYTLRLSVSDTAATGFDDVVITVNGAPIVNAGADQLINLPTNSVTLASIVTDDGLAPGTATLTYAWSRASGPGTVTFGNAGAGNTTATFSAGGAYTLRLTVSDGALTTTDELNVTVNVAPVVNAGADRTVGIADVTALQGSANDDGLPIGSGLAFNWTKVSGPGNVTFANANNPLSGVSFSALGTYILRLAVTDSAAIVTDDVVYVVMPANQAPVVNAGADQTLASIAVNATLQGTASDDGLPNGTLTLAWSKVSGPGTVTFSAPNSLITSATFSMAGVYTLRLTASDSQLSSTDDVVVTVNNANQPPIVDAGANLTVFFDVDNTAVLNGYAVDPEGATLTKQWTKVTGPGTVTFDDAASLNPVVTFSALGVYTLRLTVSDGTMTVTDDVQINVVDSTNGNQPPELFDDEYLQTVPSNTFFDVQASSVFDDGLPAGSTLSYSWRLVRGPGTATFSAPNSDVTNVTLGATGTYVLRLAVSDTQYVSEVDIVLNLRSLPTVNAGPDQTITLPTNIASLAGTATAGQPFPGTIFPRWEKISGPGVVSFANTASLTTTATFGKPGLYVLRLNVREGLTFISDDVTITVNSPAGNQAPLVSAGAAQNIVLPVTVATLNGTASDDGVPATPGLTVTWTQVSGPGTTTFANANSAATTATFSQPGIYVLRLTATDGALTTFDEVTIGYFSVYRPLFVDAGPNIYTGWFGPANTFVYPSGTVIDDSQPVRPFTSRWTKVSGPGAVSFSSDTTRQPSVSFTDPGVYVLRLTATVGAEQVFDEVTIYVGTPNQPPQIDPIEEPLLQWPTNQVSLTAVVTDDGLPVGAALSTSWRLVRGPGTVTFSAPNANTTNVTFSAPGRYWLRIATSDTLAIGEGNVYVTVNQPPQVNAGTDLTVTYPNRVTLQPTVVDDGLPFNDFGVYAPQYIWNPVGGPGTVAFSNGSLTPTVTFSTPGVYVLQLTVLDYFNATPVSDQMVVNVLPQNLAPVVSVGIDRAVTLPNNSVTLAGSATDDGYPIGTPLSLNWSKASGPGVVTFSNPSNLVTTASFSLAGVYVLRLTANDSSLSASDDLIVTVSGTNQAPLVNAGPDQQVFTPTYQVSLVGSVTDDGVPLSVPLTAAWTKVSGPGEVSFAPSNSAATSAAFSKQGTYVLRLTGSDSLLTASDDVTVTFGCGNIGPNIDLLFVFDVSGSFAGQAALDAKAAAKTLVDRLQMTTSDQGGLVSFNDFGTLNQPLTHDSALLKSKIDGLIASGGTRIDQGMQVAIQEFASPRRQPGSQPVIILMSDGASIGGNGTAQIARDAGIRVISIAYGQLGSVNLPIMRSYASSPTDFFYAPRTADLNQIYAFIAASLCRNLAPLALAGPDQNIVLPNTATLNGSASDDGVPNANGGITTRWSQVSGPAAAEIQKPDELVSDIRFTQPGVYTLRLSVSDSVLTASDDVILTVLNEPSLAGGSLTLTTTNLLTNPINTQVTVTATLKNASNQPLANFNTRINVAGVNETNAVSASGLTNANGQFTYSFVGATPGQDTLTAQVQTTAQALGSSPLLFTWTPVANILPFSIQGWIGSPLNDSNISGIVPVTVAPGVTVGTGTLELYKYECGAVSNFQVIASNVSGGPGSVLTSIDTTLLANGRYYLQLTGSNPSVTCVYGVWFNVVGENKPGRVITTEVDLTIPLSGIPITVGRRYDSLETYACPTGDFGHGRSLDMYSTNLVVSPDFDVSFTDPGTRRRVTFEFTPQSYGGLAGFIAATKYTPEPGFYGKFTEEGCGIVGKSGNGWVCPFTPGGRPTGYIYTDPYGRQYKIAPDGKLKEIKDLHGNTLTFTPNGITSSEGGRSVAFIRDGQGRITQITAKVNNTTNAVYKYFYNAAGMLDEVELPDTPIRKKYTYDTQRRLLSAKDARGNNEAVMVYTPDGRLERSTDAVGNVTQYAYDLNGGTFTVPFTSNDPNPAFTVPSLPSRGVGKAVTNEAALMQTGPVITYATATTITFPDSGVEILRYDNYGLLLAETDTLGQTSYYTYDSKRNLLTKTNDLGQTTSYKYDANGNVTSITDPLGNTKTASYNDLSMPVSDANALNQPKAILYDTENSPVEIHDSIGLLGKFSFNSKGNLISRTDGEGGTFSYLYDQFGNLTSETDPLGFSTFNTYDDFGRVLTATNARGLRDTYTYDLFGRLKEQKDSLLNIPEKYEYDGNDNLTAFTDRNNKRTTFEYDEANRLKKVTHPDLTTEEFTYNHRDQSLTAKDQRHFVTTYRYDTESRLDKITHPDGKFITATYDDIDRITSITDERGYTTQYGYDPACGCAERLTTITDPYLKVTTFLYDAAGRRIAVIDANNHKTQFVYDARGRMTKLIYPDQTVREYGYDLANRLLTDKDEAGKVTRNEYTLRGELKAVIDALNQRTEYGYNEVGSLTRINDAKSNTRRFGFDQLERLTSRVHPNVGDETYTYDPVNNLKTRRDGRGKTTTYNYDSLNRLTSVVPDATLGEATISYSYFPTGEIQTMTDGTGVTTYDHNSRSALVSKVTPTNGTLNYDYDDALNLKLIKSTNANGIWVEYTHDQKDRLETVNDRRLTPGLTSYSYDDADNLKTTTTLPNGVKTEYSYDATDLIKRVLTTKGAATLARYDYTHKPTGHRATVTELNGRRVEYDYDDAWRLTRETITGAPQAQHNGTIGYVFDRVGNRLQRNSTVAAIPGQTLSYNAGDQMSGEGYDSNGNLTSSVDGRTYTYDFEDRLKSVTLGGQTTSYSYDGNGNRVAKTVGSATTNYLNGNRNINVAEEIVNGQVKQAFTHGNAPIGQRPIVGAASYFQHDAGMHTRQLTNTAGVVTDGYDYDAYGEFLGQSGSTENQYRYRGEQYEPELDGYNLRYRYYRQNNGRFNTFDPFSGYRRDPVTMHKYSYVGADPVNYSDPLGLLSTAEYGLIQKEKTKEATIFSRLGQGIKCIIKGLAEELAEDALLGVLGVVANGGVTGPRTAGDIGGSSNTSSVSASTVSGTSAGSTSNTDYLTRAIGRKGKGSEVIDRYGSKAEAEVSKELGGLVPRPGHERQPKWVGLPDAQDWTSLGKRGLHDHRIRFTVEEGTIDWLKEHGLTKENEPNRWAVPSDKVDEFNRRVNGVETKNVGKKPKKKC